MEFSVNRERLLEALQRLSGIVDRRGVMPILSHILITLRPQGLLLTATDLDCELVARVPFEHAEVTEGQITVPAKKLFDVCRSMSDGADIRFAVEERFVSLSAKGSRFRLTRLQGEAFPEMVLPPADCEFSLSSQSLVRLIDHVGFSMANQDVRYYLNGMQVLVDSEAVRAVSTDGHRLCTYKESPQHAILEPQTFIIPRKAVIELAKLLGDNDDALSFAVSQSHLKVILPEFSFSAKLIDGIFPQYDNILPTDHRYKAVINRLQLRDALQRVAVLFSDKYRGAEIQFQTNQMTIAARNQDNDSVEEKLEIHYDGPETTMGLNVRYCLDYLSAMDDEWVSSEFSEQGSSVLFSPHEPKDGIDFRYLVMPMRL